MNENQTTQEQVKAEVTKRYRLKKGFKLLSEQRRKILQMPLLGVTAKIDINEDSTKSITMEFGKFLTNQNNVVDYLIPLFFELSDGAAVNLDELDQDDFMEMQAKIRKINPFGVFDIKPI
jgi:hypothetical protein